ncbi:PQQ-like beta-propeller repeat protein [Wolbachia endosymbiont of Howardula sp.]|nr:PQQ-binding-like beta-propeller repeat protein [Wolbachia endosymbiont of Howardula sp.]UWI83405.1 PQQ-like beta-propeller repeat protein [Wolbachia endosymbiont of Howardula sp.]
MKLIIILILLLYSDYASSASISIAFIDHKDSQGDIAPIALTHSIIIVDKYGTLYSIDINDENQLHWKLNLSHSKKICKISLACYGEQLFCVVDTILHAINVNNGLVIWSQELTAPVSSAMSFINDKLTILTIDNYLHILDVQNGRVLWSYDNGLNHLRREYSISPAIYANKIIAPFSNGELITFNEEGKKLWSQKLAIKSLETIFTDITTTPRLGKRIIVTTNNSYIYGIDLESGSIIWSQSLKVKNTSEIEEYEYILSENIKQKIERIFIVTQDNRLLGLNIQNGEIIWHSNYIQDTELFAPFLHENQLWLISNKGVILNFQCDLYDIPQVIKIPDNVFHTPVFTHDKIYVTTYEYGVFFIRK